MAGSPSEVGPTALDASARVARNGWWNALRVAVSLPVFLLLARAITVDLGDHARGAWALAGAFWLSPALFDLGLGESITRSIARARRRSRQRQRAVLVAGLLMLLAVGALLTAVYVPLGRGWLLTLMGAGEDAAGALQLADATRALDLAFLAFLIALLGWGMTRAIVGWERYDLAALLHVAGVIAYAWFALVGLHQAPALARLGEAALLSAGVGLVGGGLLLLILLSRAVSPAQHDAPTRPPTQPEHSAVRELIGFAPAIYLSTLSGLVEGFAGKIMLAAWAPGAAVVAGFYENAVEIASRLRTLPHLLAAPLFPAAAAVDSPLEFAELARTGMRRNALVATPLLVGGVAFAWHFTWLWLGGDVPASATVTSGGDRVHETATALAVLSFGMYAQTLYVPCFHLWNGRGRPWPGTCASLISAAINLTLAFALVEGHGLRGVAGAATAGHIVAAALFLTWFHRSERMSLWTTMLNEVVPPLAAMTASAGLCEFILESLPRTWLAFLAASGGSVVLYVVLLVLMGHIRGGDIVAELRLHLASRPAPAPADAGSASDGSA